MPGRTRTLVAIDLGVGASLLLGWLTIPLAVPHLVLGCVFAVLVGVHLATRPRRLAALIRASGRPRRPAGTRKRFAAVVILGLAAIGATVTGFVQWAGIAPGPANGLHSMTSGVLFGFAIRHVWVRRPILLQRLRRRRTPAA